MVDDFFKNLISNAHPLYPAILEFNYLPALYIHDSRLPDYQLERPLLAPLLKSRRVIWQLSKAILDNLKIADEYCWDFSEEQRQWVFLTNEQLEKIIQLAGLAIHSSHISRIIKKEEISQLVARLGRDAYTFALKKAPFLLGNLPLDAWSEGNINSNWHERITSSGRNCLASVFAGEPAALTKRFNLKMPVGQELSFEGKTDPRMEPMARQLIKRIIHRELCYS